MTNNQETTSSEPLLKASGVVKNYGGIHALRGVDFSINRGEVRGLVGENGAGKSTLVKVFAGAVNPEVGTVEVDGEELVLGDPQLSLATGISTVYQEPTLFGELSVMENIFIGREIASGGRIDWKQEYSRGIELLELLGLDPSLADQTVADLPIGEQQLVSIAKAFAAEVKLLILDEPSAILSDSEISILFKVVTRMKESGTGVIYISHRLDELAKITDAVTVMRDGCVVTTARTAELSARKIAELMVGHELETTIPPRIELGDKILEVSHLKAGKALKDVSFDLCQGEILGVYGLVGSGSGDIARALYGIDPKTGGIIKVDGRPTEVGAPIASKRAGFTMAPGNRRRDGVFLEKSLVFNMASSHFDFFSSAFGWMKEKKELTAMNQMMTRLQIKAPGPHTAIGSLSGGNQQKVVISRQLVGDAKITILEEPTQGVDVGAQAEIHRLVFNIAESGGACIVVSTDLEEVRTLCDRILVMHGGTLSAELKRGCTSADLLAAASGDTEAINENVLVVARPKKEGANEH